MKTSFHFRGKQVVDTSYGLSDSTSINVMSKKGMTMKNDMDGDVVILPSVLERLRSLQPNISSSHPMHQPINDLITLLNEGDGQDEEGEEENIMEALVVGNIEYEEADHDNSINQHQLDRKRFEKIFQTFQKAIKVHKLHAIILKSVLQCNDSYNWYRIHDDGNAIDLNFDQYLGDVYITIILMGNISSGLVEGVSEKKWEDSIFNESDPIHYTMDTHFNNYASSTSSPTSNYFSAKSQARIWYRGWIFLHSTLLRSIALTSDERTQLGLSINGAFMKKTSSMEIMESTYDSNVRMFPPTPFRGAFDSRTMIHLYNKLNLYDGRLTVLFRDFGSLGPTFRGRDSVRSHSLPSMRTLIEIINQYSTSDSGRFMRDNSHDQEHHETIMLLALLHQKSKKTRPMTCAPHKVCMQRFTRSLY